MAINRESLYEILYFIAMNNICQRNNEEVAL